MRSKRKTIEMCTHGIIVLLIMFIGVISSVKDTNENVYSTEEQSVSKAFETEWPQNTANIYKEGLKDCKVTEPKDSTETRQIKDVAEGSKNESESSASPENFKTQYPRFAHSRNWNKHEQYLLAKLAMCEAGTQSVRTKCLVILTVYNRVHDNRFPNTVKNVIYQNNGKTWQYSPLMPGGSWNKSKPDKDCYKAVAMVMSEQFDYSGGAMYFESFGTNKEAANSWHGRCLEYLYQSDDIRFYK